MEAYKIKFYYIKVKIFRIDSSERWDLQQPVPVMQEKNKFHEFKEGINNHKQPWYYYSCFLQLVTFSANASFRSSLKSHWLGDTVSILGVHQLIFSLLSVSVWDLLNTFFQDKFTVGTASPKQCRCKLVVDMLLFLSVDVSLEFLGANSFLSFPGPFPPLRRHPHNFFSSVPKDLTEIWQQLGI